MKFFKKSHGTWTVSFSEIQKYIKKNPADEDILTDFDYEEDTLPITSENELIINRRYLSRLTS